MHTACVVEGAHSGTWRASFRIGEVTLGLNADQTFARVLSPQIESFHFAAAACDLEIDLAWVSGLAQPQGRLLFDSGSVWKLHEALDGEGVNGFQFDFSSPALGVEPYKRLRVDRDFRQGRILLNRRCFPDPASCNPLEYPLDELMVLHRLGRERGVEVHAAGMHDADGNAYLFLGHSGAGKSTTTRLWNQQHDMTVLSDDRIILRIKNGLPSNRLPAKDRAGVVEVDKVPVEKFQVWMHGTPWHGEAAFAAPEKARIERLFILEHASANRITPLRGGQAVAEIMARSFLPFYDAVSLENTMSFLEDIVATIPCYRLGFLPDGSAVEAVRQFRS